VQEESGYAELCLRRSGLRRSLRSTMTRISRTSPSAIPNLWARRAAAENRDRLPLCKEAAPPHALSALSAESDAEICSSAWALACRFTTCRAGLAPLQAGGGLGGPARRELGTSTCFPRSGARPTRKAGTRRSAFHYEPRRHGSSMLVSFVSVWPTENLLVSLEVAATRFLRGLR